MLHFAKLPHRNEAVFPDTEFVAHAKHWTSKDVLRFEFGLVVDNVLKVRCLNFLVCAVNIN